MSTIKTVPACLGNLSIIGALTFAVALSAQVQTAPSASSTAAPEEKDEVLELSVYRVTPSEDQGYSVQDPPGHRRYPAGHYPGHPGPD
jgi:translation elongation factor EF-Tu-like GTPase